MLLPEEKYTRTLNISDEGLLYQAFSESRMIKSAHEIEVMRYVSRVTTEGHI